MSSSANRKPLRVAILGTRGVPARYGGFETFAEELGSRLAERGHQVGVLGRTGYVDERLFFYRRMRILALPAVRHKYLETVSHSLLSLSVAAFSEWEVILLCNAANSIWAWIPSLAGQKVIINVDGIERKRKKWNWAGRLFYRFSEFLATQMADLIVADARHIQEYYRVEYSCLSRFIAYGAPVGRTESHQVLDKLGLEPDGFILYVSRLEPENNAHLVIEAYLESGCEIPLLVVGDAPYSRTYIRKLREMASRGKVILPGAIYGDGYRELLTHCRCFVQATEVGGTHPALIEAMGAGCVVLVNHTPENAEVVEDCGLLYAFNDRVELARLLGQVGLDPGPYRALGRRAQERIARHYNWDQVVGEYEDACYSVLNNLAG